MPSALKFTPFASPSAEAAVVVGSAADTFCTADADADKIETAKNDKSESENSFFNITFSQVGLIKRTTVSV
jgi:hypothetical protein